MTKTKWVRDHRHHEWTTKEIDYLRNLWMRGFTIHEIADQATLALGFRITGPMVGGIAFRNREKFPLRKPHQRRSRASYGR